MKGDERILGDSDFVTRILSESKEVVARRYALRSQGMDVDSIAEKVAGLLDLHMDLFLVRKLSAPAQGCTVCSTFPKRRHTDKLDQTD